MSKFKSFDEDRAKELIEEAVSQMDGEGESRPRLKIRDQMNVFWVLPLVGKMAKPLVPMNIHYRPVFFRCGRDCYPDPKKDEQFKSQGFRECPLCIGSWNMWDAAGTPGQGNKESKDPVKRKFLDGMPSTQFVCNAIQLDSFFTTDSKGKYAKPDTDLVDKWSEDFVAVMKGEIEPPEDMPEEMAEAAQAGVQPLVVNDTVGRQIMNEHYDVRMRTDSDPLMDPGSTLLQIKRSNQNSTFMSGGKTRYKKNYEVKFTLDRFMEDWTLPDGIFDVAEDQVQDLTNPESDEEELRGRASDLVRLTNEEVEQLLDESGYVFSPDDDAGGDGGEDDADFSDFSGGGGDTMDADKRQKFEAMKRKMQAADEDD